MRNSLIAPAAFMLIVALLLTFVSCKPVANIAESSSVIDSSVASHPEADIEQSETLFSEEPKQSSEIPAISSVPSESSTISSSQAIPSQQLSSVPAASSAPSQSVDPQVEDFFYVGKHNVEALENWVIEQWNKTSGVNKAVYAKTCEWGPLDMDNADWAGSSTTTELFQGYKFKQKILKDIEDAKNNLYWKDANYMRFYSEPNTGGRITFVWVYIN